MRGDSVSVRLLLVDDDPVFNMLAKVIFEHVGITHEVSEFLSGDDLFFHLDRLHPDQGRYLILLDINMPLLSGWDVLDRLEHHPLKSQMMVVVTTSSVNPADEVKSKSYPLVVDYLTKPISIPHFEGLKARFKSLDPNS